jgi:NDP-sugar pyrophosphorylase family protein
VEREPLGRGGAFRLGFEQVPASEQTVIGTNGDNLIDQSLAPLLRVHARNRAVATVLLAPLRSPYGVVRLRGSRVLGFEEKPLLPYWVNAGVYALEREFFSMLPEVGDHETTAFPELAKSGRLFGYRCRGFWKPIDSLKDVREAEILKQEKPPCAPAKAGHGPVWERRDWKVSATFFGLAAGPGVPPAAKVGRSTYPDRTRPESRAPVRFCGGRKAGGVMMRQDGSGARACRGGKAR